jgi:tyrosine-specific transport protein
MYRRWAVASLILSGTIIGAGMFGLPYAFSRVGVSFSALFILVLAAFLGVLHVAYGLIALHTPGDHRLPGYARIYLGERSFPAVLCVNTLSLVGGLVVYIALALTFVSHFVSSPAAAYAIVVATFALPALFGVKAFEGLEWTITLCMVALILVIFGFGAARTGVETESERIGQLSDAALLYGVGLFALYGASAIPELKKYFTSVRSVVVIAAVGTALPAFLYIAFSVGIIGLSGGAPSHDALSAIVGMPWVQGVGAVLGFLAVTTSYWAIATNLTHMLVFDLRIPRTISTGAVLVVPFGLYAAVNTSFIDIMGFVGSVALSLEALAIVGITMIVRKKVPEVASALSLPALTGAGILFTAGFLYYIVS